MRPDLEAREYFLILLLKEISQRLSGRPFAIKGGICLRFFYQSPRLSEDMDLDIAQVSVSTLKGIIKKILNSQSFNIFLENQNIRIAKYLASKQTPTTQRWKITLSLGGRLLSTKLEFSRRRGEIPFTSGIPDNSLLSKYEIVTFVTQHYSLEEMIKQKILALASPTRQAARDLFDLYYLINKKITEKTGLPQKIIIEAFEKCKNISPTTFKTQVVPFLPEDLTLFFGNLNNYRNLQKQVENYLSKEIQK